MMDRMTEFIRQKTEVVVSFNNLSLQMANFIGNMYQNSHFAIYRQTIKVFFDNHPDEPIAIFIKYVYSNDEYRLKIKDGDETFFLDQSYNHITSDNKDKISKMFEFKTLWLEFDLEMRSLIKNFMQLLVQQAERYIDIQYNINKFKTQFRTQLKT